MKHSSQLDADQGIGEREAAWEAQRRILVDDSERLRQSLHQVTRERDELGHKLAAVTGKSGAVGKTPPPSGGVSMADFMLERKAYEAEVGNHIISRGRWCSFWFVVLTLFICNRSQSFRIQQARYARS